MPERGFLRGLAAVERWFWVVVPLSLATTGIAPIMLPLEVEQIEGKALHVGLVMASVGAGLLTAPLWTRLAERWNAHRDLIVGGALGIALALAVFHFAHEVHEWASLAFIMGSSAAAVFTVANLLVMRCYPPETQHARFGWLQTLTTVGTVAGLFVAGVITHLGWNADPGFALGAVLALGAAIFAGAKVPAAPPLAEPVTPPGAEPRAETEPASVAGLSSLAGRRTFPFVLLVTLWAIGNVGQGAIGALYPLLMREDFALAPALSSYALAVATALSILFFLPASRLTARFGGLSVLQGAFGVKLVCLGMILAMSLVAWFDQGARGWLVFFPFGVSGLAWPFLSVSGILMVSRLSPGNSGPGFFDAASAGSFLIGPVIGGHVADEFGYTSVWILALVGIVIGLVLSLPLRGSHRSIIEKATEA